MLGSRIWLRWVLANAVGMGLGFLAFVEMFFLLSYGFDFSQHWVEDSAAKVADRERTLRMGLALGLPLAGIIFSSFQALSLRGRLRRPWFWILAGPTGFVTVLLVVWPFTRIWGNIPGPVEPFTIVGGGLTATVVLQWMSLRFQGTKAGLWAALWLVGLPLGMIVFMGVYMLLDLVISISWAGEVALIGSMIGGTAAAISGGVLLRSLPPDEATPSSS